MSKMCINIQKSEVNHHLIKCYSQRLLKCLKLFYLLNCPLVQKIECREAKSYMKVGRRTSI
jgi:hypothetical protein